MWEDNPKLTTLLVRKKDKELFNVLKLHWSSRQRKQFNQQDFFLETLKMFSATAFEIPLRDLKKGGNND